MNAPHYVLRPTLREQLDRLKAQTEETAETRSAIPISQSPLIDTYVDQVSKWIASMTTLQRQRTYTLQEIIALAGLKGRFRIQASNQMTGEALRRCGLSSQREWSKRGRGRRYWKLNQGKI